MYVGLDFLGKNHPELEYFYFKWIFPHTQCYETSALKCFVQILLIISHLLWFHQHELFQVPYGMQTVPVLLQRGEKKPLQNLFGLLAVAIDLQQDTQSLVQVNTQLAFIIPSNPLWVCCKSHCGL